MKVTKEMIHQIGMVMINKAEIVKFTKNDEEFKNNIRFNPIYSELKGMEQTLKLMGIEFEYEFDDNYDVVALTIAGQRFVTK